MKQTILFALFLVSGFMGFGQNPLVKQWDKRYGGTDDEWLTSFLQTKDGGYILGGYTFSDSSGDISKHSQNPINNLPDYWVVRTDSIGNKLWEKRFGGNKYDYLSSIKETKDGGYILGGTSNSDSSGDVTQQSNGNNDYWIIKTDSIGNKLWDKRYGGRDNEYWGSVIQTFDGGYLIGGTTYSDSSGNISQSFLGGVNSTDYWIVKTDSSGTIMWEKRFGGNFNEYFSSALETIDQGYVLSGYTYTSISVDVTQQTRGGNDYWVLKIDSNGHKLWDKRFGGNQDDNLHYIQQTYDHGYILGGCTHSDGTGDVTQNSRGASDYWIVKIDSVGNKLWDKRYGGNYDEDGFGFAIQINWDSYLLSGSSYSGIIGDKTESNLGMEQTWILKIDLLGNKQWDKTIFTTGHDEIGFAITTQDGCYTIASQTNSGIGGYKTEQNWDITNPFTYDFWLIKFCDTTSCNLSSPTVQATQSIFCSGDSTQICATTSSFTYLWNTGEITPCIYANHAGNYYVTVADVNNCSAVSNHLAINVYPIPPVSISVNGDTLHAFNAVSYQWYFNGNIINGATDSVYVANQTGNYTVSITDTNGCRVTSNAVNVVVSGIASFAIPNSEFRIYPNPATSQLFIETNGEEIKQVNIYNTMGAVVIAVQPQTVNCKLQTVNLPSGVYIAEVKRKDASVKKRWVKE